MMISKLFTIRVFSILPLFLLLIFLNDGLPHPQVQDSPKFNTFWQGDRMEWVSAVDVNDDHNSTKHPTQKRS